MNIRDSINRGFNLLGVSIVALSGCAFLPEVFVEKDMPDKIDDALLFLLALIALFWYNRSNNRFIRTSIPIILIAVGLIVKLGGLIVEISDPESFGDDVGGLILFVLGTALVIRQYGQTGKMLESAAA